MFCHSASASYSEAVQRVLPYLDHFGVPYEVLDLRWSPVPADVVRYALIVIGHGGIAGAGWSGEGILRQAARRGSGIVSFDPAFGATASEIQSTAETIEFAEQPHWITARHEPGEVIRLFSPLLLASMEVPAEGALVAAGGCPLLVARQDGAGRIVRWTSTRWMHSDVLGPLAGLDDVLWRSLVWAARKPFAMRGLPPLVAMRVDDVAARGGLWRQSPLFWVRTANRVGFKPWLGLFLLNLTVPAVAELRELILRGEATAFPHAFGRPPGGTETLTWYEPAEIHGAPGGDEFIYWDHARRRPWADAEAARRLEAVDSWYAAHAPLPMSRYGVPHWYELGRNTVEHLHDRWGVRMICTMMDVDQPYSDDVPWLRAEPFRQYETPRAATGRGRIGGQRPVYYADTVWLGNRAFFACATEIRDDAGYEWAPDNNVEATVGRGVRQLRRALDSMAPAVLFTHEIDYVHSIRPEHWEESLRRIAAGIVEYAPMYVTLDEAAHYVRATRTSRLERCQYDPENGRLRATLRGTTDIPTHFYLFTGHGDEIEGQLVEVPPFEGETVVETACD